MVRKGFRKEPGVAGDLGEGHRFHAACAAVQTVEVENLASDAKAEWRGQTLEWLRADLNVDALLAELE
jgi:hypothetical protein